MNTPKFNSHPNVAYLAIALSITFLPLTIRAQQKSTLASLQDFEQDWITYNSVDFSTLEHPGWWNKQDVSNTKDSLSLIGMSFNRRNPEFIACRLSKKIKKNELFLVKLRVKPLSPDTVLPTNLFLALTKHRVGKNKLRQIKVEQLYTIHFDSGCNEEDWYEVVTEFKAKRSVRWITFGPFDALTQPSLPAPNDIEKFLLLAQFSVLKN